MPVRREGALAGNQGRISPSRIEAAISALSLCELEDEDHGMSATTGTADRAGHGPSRDSLDDLPLGVRFEPDSSLVHSFNELAEADANPKAVIPATKEHTITLAEPASPEPSRREPDAGDPVVGGTTPESKTDSTRRMAKVYGDLDSPATLSPAVRPNSPATSSPAIRPDSPATPSPVARPDSPATSSPVRDVEPLILEPPTTTSTVGPSLDVGARR